MKKVFKRNVVLLALFLMVVQLFFPYVNALANSTMLPPSNLASQQITPDDVKLTWSPVFGATGYNVYEITEGQLILREKVTATSYNLNNLAEGSYRFVVSTLSTEGESGPGVPVSFEITYPEMKSPQTVTQTIKNGNDIVLTWDSSSYAETYNLYQIAEDGQKTLVTSLPGRTYTITNAAEGTYAYQLSAENSLYGESQLSTPVQVEVDFPTMQTPTNFTYSVANGNDVTLKWSSVPYATSYKLYQITEDGKFLVSTTNSTLAKFTNVDFGSYTYEVHSYSERFGESLGEDGQLKVIVDEVTMTAPSNFLYKLQNINDVILTWGSVPYATNYKVYQIIDGVKVLKSTVTGTSASYTRVPAGDYVYQVYSNSERFGESLEGSQVSFTVEHVEMKAPSDFTHKIQNGNDIVLSWGSTENTTNYKIYQIIDGEKILKSTINGTTITYTNMPAGNYIFEVHSYSDRFGESVEGSQSYFTLEQIQMVKPDRFTHVIQNGNDIVLSWDSVSYANNYKIYQIIDGKKVLKNTVSATTFTYGNMPEGEYTYEIHSYSTRFGESIEGSKVELSLVHPKLTPPTNVIETIKNDTDFTISWDASELSEFVNTYRVYQIVDGRKVLKSNTTSTSVNFTSMPSGEYTYVVYSYSSRFGESVEGTQLTFTLKGKTMLAPTEPTYTISNGNDIRLNWKASENATNYNVYQIVDGVKVLKNTTTSTTIYYSNLPEGDYQYIIHAYSTLFGESAEGAELSIQLQHPTIKPPSNVSYKIQNGNDVVFNWDAVDYGNTYKVYEVVDGEKVLKNTVSSLSTIMYRVPPGEHTYVFHTVSTRFGESKEGSTLHISLAEYTMEAPENVTHSITNVNTLTLNWDAVSFANKYKVYQILDGEKILKGTANGTGVTYTNLAEGEYIYEVYSVSDRFGESPEGSQVSFEIVYPKIEAPQNLTSKIQNGNDVVLNWEASEYANQYRVYELLEGEKVLKSTISPMSVVLQNVSEGDHTYIVHAVSSRFGESLEGEKLDVTVVHPTMLPPENIEFSIANGNDITIKWEASEYASNYKVYQLIDGEKVLRSTVSGTSIRYNNQPEGDYQFEVHSVSTRFGESPNETKVTFPLVFPTMQAPENVTSTITYGNDITLTWDKSEYATSYKVYQIINGEKVLKSTLTDTYVKYTNQPEGDYQYEVHSFSSRFGESPEGQKESFPLVFPVMLAPNNVTYSVTNGNDLTLKWNASTYATSYNVYRIVDGQQEFVKTVNGTAVSFTNMPEENYEYVVHSYSNRFGESPEGNKVDFTLTWPVVQAPLVTGTVFNVNNITFTWPGVAWANEYRVYKTTHGTRDLLYKGPARTFTAYNLAEDTHSFEVTAYSTRFGESEQSNAITETIVYPEMESPEASLILLSETSARIYWDFVTYANGYNIYELVDGERVLIADKVNNLSYTINNLPYANHEYIVTSYSNSFGESDPSNIVLAKLIIDEVAPVTTINGPTEWVNHGVDISLTATDNEVGVAKTYYSLGGEWIEGTSFSLEDEGVHWVSFYSVDKVGNIENIQTIEVKIDKTKPQTTSNVEEVWGNEDYQVELTATDNLSGVAKTFYSVNGIEFIEGTSFIVTDEAVNEVSFYSVDNAGNVEEVQTVQVKIDKTKPVTTSNVTDTWLQNDFTVELAGTDNLSGVAETFYSVNGNGFASGLRTLISEEGISTVSFYSVDNAGNIEAIQTTQVKIDKTAPFITLDVAEEYALGTDLSLTYATTDNLSGIAHEKMTVNGRVVQNGEVVSFDQPGKYVIEVEATDHAGWTTTIKKTVLVYIPATIEVLPKVMNGNKGAFTVKVDWPMGYSSKDFNLETATLNGVSSLASNKGYYKQAEQGQFKFEREDFFWVPGQMTMEFVGKLGNFIIKGQIDVKVIK